MKNNLVASLQVLQILLTRKGDLKYMIMVSFILSSILK